MLIVQKTLNLGSHFILLLTLSANAEKLILQPVKCAMQCYFHLHLQSQDSNDFKYSNTFSANVPQQIMKTFKLWELNMRTVKQGNFCSLLAGKQNQT